MGSYNILLRKVWKPENCILQFLKLFSVSFASEFPEGDLFKRRFHMPMGHLCGLGEPVLELPTQEGQVWGAAGVPSPIRQLQLPDRSPWPVWLEQAFASHSFLDTESPRSMCWQVGCLPATLFLVCRGPSLRVVLPCRVESRRRALPCLGRAHRLLGRRHCLPEDPPPHTVTLGVRIRTTWIWGGLDIHSTTVPCPPDTCVPGVLGHNGLITGEASAALWGFWKPGSG